MKRAVRRKATREASPAFPEVRGWGVVTLVDGESAGEVEDLVSDSEGTPRYFAIRLPSDSTRVLLPVGHARADAEHRRLWVPGLTGRQLEQLPEWEPKGPAPDRSFEIRVLMAFQRLLEGGEDGGPGLPVCCDSPPGEPGGLQSGELPEIAALSDLDGFRVSEDEPDPRGWPVLLGDGTRLGEVEELLVSTSAMKVRYLICSRDDRPPGPQQSPHWVLLPAPLVRLDADAGMVHVDGLTERSATRLPSYSGTAVDQHIDQEIAALVAEESAGSAFYEQPSFRLRDCFGPDAA